MSMSHSFHSKSSITRPTPNRRAKKEKNNGNNKKRVEKNHPKNISHGTEKTFLRTRLYQKHDGRMVGWSPFLPIIHFVLCVALTLFHTFPPPPPIRGSKQTEYRSRCERTHVTHNKTAALCSAKFMASP